MRFVKWQILVSERRHRSLAILSCVCVVHPPRGNRDALRKRAHYRRYATGYNFIHEVPAPSRSFAFTFSRRVPSGEPDVPRPPRLPLLLPLYPSSYLLHHLGPCRAVAEDDSATRGTLAGDCYVRKKPSRAKSVDNLNYISHHNPRAG